MGEGPFFGGGGSGWSAEIRSGRCSLHTCGSRQGKARQGTCRTARFSTCAMAPERAACSSSPANDRVFHRMLVVGPAHAVPPAPPLLPRGLHAHAACQRQARILALYSTEERAGVTSKAELVLMCEQGGDDDLSVLMEHKLWKRGVVGAFGRRETSYQSKGPASGDKYCLAFRRERLSSRWCLCQVHHVHVHVWE